MAGVGHDGRLVGSESLLKTITRDLLAAAIADDAVQTISRAG